MVDEIRVRILPGCPGIIVAEDAEGKELAKATLANTECGCIVKTEAEIAELTEAEIEEADELAQEAVAGELAEETEEAEEAEEAPVCSLEPGDRSWEAWEKSPCGVTAREAGRQAADIVMVRLREEGLIS
ncbi:hypothetical protein ES703_112582 [subsurface metagenome]